MIFCTCAERQKQDSTHTHTYIYTHKYKYTEHTHSMQIYIYIFAPFSLTNSHNLSHELGALDMCTCVCVCYGLVSVLFRFIPTRNTLIFLSLRFSALHFFSNFHIYMCTHTHSYTCEQCILTLVHLGSLGYCSAIVCAGER